MKKGVKCINVKHNDRNYIQTCLTEYFARQQFLALKAEKEGAAIVELAFYLEDVFGITLTDEEISTLVPDSAEKLEQLVIQKQRETV